MKLLSTLIAGSALAIAAPALAGDGYMKADKMQAGTVMQADTTMKTSMVSNADFAAYDRNSDARVDFAEYSKWAKKEGLSTTAAAQRFTKMTQGQAYLDEGTFLSAMSLGNTYYDTMTYDGVRNGATYIGNTAVLGTSVDSNGNVILPQSDADTTIATGALMTDTDVNMQMGTTVNTLPSATVDPMYRPADKVGGDLTQTNNPMMDVRPTTIDDETYIDARPDFTTPVE